MTSEAKMTNLGRSVTLATRLLMTLDRTGYLEGDASRPHFNVHALAGSLRDFTD